ncbi:MAG: TagF domain-containing protein, partial [Desulfobacterales bacterium]|nr:TagF domain-containing protein [Desulfobacterales bacterium]
MLGLGKLKNTWDWAACGKHPVARDYLRIGLTTALLVAFESWFEKGYQMLSSQGSIQSVNSWRFWAKGIKKGSLVCGVAKESSDSIGRPYPLLIMGDGILEGWEEDWDLLHDVFEKTWDQIEHISSRHYDDLKGLENEVCTIENPGHYWLELKSKNRNPSKPESLVNALTISMSHDEIREKVRHLSKNMEVHIPLDNQTIGNLSDMAGLWCSLLKSHSSGVPSAVFMGGIP